VGERRHRAPRRGERAAVIEFLFAAPLLPAPPPSPPPVDWNRALVAAHPGDPHEPFEELCREADRLARAAERARAGLERARLERLWFGSQS
jgi:hypothetical protein